MAGQRPPDLDAAGKPTSTRPPDLDAGGQPISPVNGKREPTIGPDAKPRERAWNEIGLGGEHEPVVMGAPVSPIGVAAPALRAGMSAAGRVYAGAKAAMGPAVPLVKYEVAKTALEAAGVPSGWATVAAGIFAGRSGSKAKSAPRTPRAKAPAVAKAPPVAAEAPAVVAEAAPVAAATVAAPAAARAGWSPSGMSPQRIQNELGLAARRSGAKLTEPQYNEAAELVMKGATPLDAVKSVAGSAPAKAVAASKPRMSAAESKEYVRLRSMGKTNAEAVEALTQQRAFAAKFGTPTSEDVRTRVAARNASGRWQ